MRNQKLLSVFAWLMAFCLLLGGCTSDTPAPEGSLRGTTVHEALDFSALAYTRPDFDSMNARLDEALALVEQSGKEEELLGLYEEILASIGTLDTMYTLASIRRDLDVTDPYYEAEVLALDEFYTAYDNRMIELTGAILDSPYADAAAAAWGQEFIDRYEYASGLNSPEVEELKNQETALVNEYIKLLAQDFTTTLGGVEVTLDDLDLTTEEGVWAYYEIYQKRNSALGEIYRQLIPIRVEIANRLGYESYTDYAYDLLGRDYTKEDAAAFAEQVKEVLAPLYQQLDDQYYLLISEAYERSDVTFDDGLPLLREALKSEYPAKMSEALDYMLNSNLFVFGNDPNMMQAGYTTILSDYCAPYLFINTGIYQDPGTLFHEFGHYYNFYLWEPLLWNDSNNLDIAEIHSQGLEVLMFNRYPELYGGDADLMALNTLLNLLGSVLQGCAEELFQQQVFENPNLTLEEINDLHEQIYAEYFGYPIRYEWVEIHHHYETPFYYISYATSAISALEIWELSTESRSEALETYDKITQNTINAQYLEALEASGLQNPFTSNCVEQIAGALEAWTSGIDASYQQAA